MGLSSIIVDHPNVTAASHSEDGDMAAVRSGDGPCLPGASLAPQGRGVALKVHMQEGGTGGRLTGDKERLGIRSPIDGVEPRPALHDDGAFRLTVQREQPNATFARTEFHEYNARCVRRNQLQAIALLRHLLVIPSLAPHPVEA